MINNDIYNDHEFQNFLKEKILFFLKIAFLFSSKIRKTIKIISWCYFEDKEIKKYSKPKFSIFLRMINSKEFFI